MKNIIFILITIFVLSLSCATGDRQKPIFNITKSNADPSTDVIIECSENIEWNLKVYGGVNNFTYSTKYGSDINYSSYDDGTADYNPSNSLKYDKIDDRHLKIHLPNNITTNRLFIRQRGLQEIGQVWGETFTNNRLQINYPITISFNKNNVKIGDEITITSTKPFFDSNTFTREKLEFLLDKFYYIVWIEAKHNDYFFVEKIGTSPYYDKEMANINKEKYPVKKEYYVIEKITPTSVTFKIPEYAKTGKVHILNEGGFVEVKIPWGGQMYPEQRLHEPLVIDKTATAYYTSSEELIISE